MPIVGIELLIGLLALVASDELGLLLLPGLALGAVDGLTACGLPTLLLIDLLDIPTAIIGVIEVARVILCLEPEEAHEAYSKQE